MKLLKKLMILFVLELSVLFFVLAFSGCETEDNCQTCFDCSVMANNGTFCESNFDSSEAFNDAVAELVSGGCSCD